MMHGHMKIKVLQQIINFRNKWTLITCYMFYRFSLSLSMFFIPVPITFPMVSVMYIFLSFTVQVGDSIITVQLH